MPLIDFILNIAGLLLWLNWLSISFDPMARATAASLIGTLKKADASRPKRWKSLLGLAALLGFRAVIYWEIGSAAGWNPSLELGSISLSFRSDFPGKMLLFSLLSFSLTLGIFYLWLLLLSIANSSVPDTDPLQKLVRLHLRWLEKWPRGVKAALPILLTGLLWLAFYPLLLRLGIIPAVKSSAHLIEQAAVLGLGSYIAWKYLIVGVLLLHLLNSYIYLGDHPVWNFVNATANNFLHPLRWLPLCAGKVDFAPLVAVALIFLLAQFGSHGLVFSKSFIIPGLTQLYERLPL